jgi:hypothetical protein
MTRLSLLEAEYEVDGSAFNAGRIAFAKGDTDNPFWESGLFRSEQSWSALTWLEGYESEAKLAEKEEVSK